MGYKWGVKALNVSTEIGFMFLEKLYTPGHVTPYAGATCEPLFVTFLRYL